MAYLIRTSLGILWAAATSTAVLAQAAAKPIELRDPADYQSTSFSITTDSNTWYGARVYGLALRGITFADSTALKQLAVRQLAEIWQQAGKDWWSTLSGNKATERAMPKWQGNHAALRKLFDQFLPELRSVVPADQRTTLDQNLKALQQADYTVVVVIDTTLPANRDNHANGEELSPIECVDRKGRCP